MSETTVTLGNAIVVENQQRRFWEAANYVAVHVEDANGKGDRCILFTPKEFDALTVVDGVELQNLLVVGRLYPITTGNLHGYFLVTREYQPALKAWVRSLRRVPKSVLKTAEQRAAKNQEDLTKRSWFNRLFDR